jgi:hypothetical protein
MKRDKRRILKMIGSGKVSAEEGRKMLVELQRSSPAEEHSTSKLLWSSFKVPKLLKIKVKDENTKINLWIPIPLIMMFLPLGKLMLNLAPQEIRDNLKKKGLLEVVESLSAREIYNIFRTIKRDVPDGKIVEVEDNWGETRVEIVVL